MQRATRDVLYYETGRDNPVTMTVTPGEVFEVETQMNRGRDASEVPEDLRDLWNSKRSDDSPTDRGNPTSGAIWVEGAEPGHALTVHVEDIQVHGIGYTQYRGSTGAAPGIPRPQRHRPPVQGSANRGRHDHLERPAVLPRRAHARRRRRRARA